MSQTLYRKYRPQTFAEVVGQPHVTTTLENQLKRGTLAHAYLFCGIRGVGKTTMARLLAKALNCTERAPGQAEPCGHCDSCLAIATGRSLDVIEIDAASNRRIDDVRQLREQIPVGPAHARYKVVIVDEVHMLTAEAFNALLKTLEEPPAHVIFILATTEVHKVPDTILSRCQRFDFHRLGAADIVARLGKLAQAEGVTVADEVLREIAYLAAGSSRDAESYLGKLLGLGEKHITSAVAAVVLPHSDLKTTLAFIGLVVRRQTAEALTLLNRFLDEGGEVNAFHRQVLELLRKLLLMKLGGGLGSYTHLELTAADEAELTELTLQTTTARLQHCVQAWLEAATSRRSGELYQLPLELATVSMCELPYDHSPAQATAAGAPAAVAAPDQPSSNVPGAGPRLNAILERWGQVVAKLREYNHSLSFILSIAQPTRLEGKTLTVSFQYKLHQERVNDRKVRSAIEATLKDVLGHDYVLQAVVAASPTVEPSDVLSSVLTTFGGQVAD